MNETDRVRFRQKLLRMKHDLQALDEVATEAGKTVELDQARLGRLSRMDALQNQQMAQETDRRRQQQIRLIEGALRRIDAGDFGFCTVCGEEIDIRRLELDPTYTRCIRCAE